MCHACFLPYLKGLAQGQNWPSCCGKKEFSVSPWLSLSRGNLTTWQSFQGATGRLATCTTSQQVLIHWIRCGTSVALSYMYTEDDFEQLSLRKKVENINEIKKCPLLCHCSSISIILALLLSVSLYSSIFHIFWILKFYVNLFFYY